MSLYKRNKIWHTDFSVDGQRFRQSLETRDWREAQSKEKELIAQASEGKLTPKGHEFSRLGFSEAAERYLTDKLPRLAQRSIQTERERLIRIRDSVACTIATNVLHNSILQRPGLHCS